MGKPIVFDFYCGLGGWSEAFIAEGYSAIGFDIEAHDYGNGGYPGQLILRDIRSLNGAELVKEFGVPAVLACSPPCTEYSYMAMPWKRGKQIAAALRGQGDFTVGYKGSRTIAELNDLFNQCFRIQREVSAAAGHYVPMIVENVRGAQEWVGKARWNFGSFYLWGDVPALMPIPGKARRDVGVKAGDRNKGAVNGEHKWSSSFSDTLKDDGTKVGISWSKSGPGNHGQSFQTAAIQKCEGNKTAGMNWSDRSIKGQDFTRIAGQQAEGVKQLSESGRRTDPGKGVRFTSRDCGDEGNKNFKDFHDSPIAALGSKSKARKQSSAEIAKIPYALASWIAKIFKPKI